MALVIRRPASSLRAKCRSLAALALAAASASFALLFLSSDVYGSALTYKRGTPRRRTASAKSSPGFRTPRS